MHTHIPSIIHDIVLLASFLTGHGSQSVTNFFSRMGSYSAGIPEGYDEGQIIIVMILSSKSHTGLMAEQFVLHAARYLAHENIVMNVELSSISYTPQAVKHVVPVYCGLV